MTKGHETKPKFHFGLISHLVRASQIFEGEERAKRRKRRKKKEEEESKIKVCLSWN